MPRIRTIKPECHQHRKVGALTDREFRVWVGCITQADDEGRWVADAAQVRATFFAYHPDVTIMEVEAAIDALAAIGLVRLYDVDGIRYGWFQSWHDHQRINKPQASRLPAFRPHSTTTPVALPEQSRNGVVGSESLGSESLGSRIGTDTIGKGVEPEARENLNVNDALKRETTSSKPSNGSKRLAPKDTPPEWFNNCGEGRRRQCVKTEYLGLVDLPIQCNTHEKARRQLSTGAR